MAQQIAAKCREIRKFLCCISNDFHNMKQTIEKDQFDKFILFFEQGKVKPQDYEDDTGNNPLHLTVKAGRHQMVEYILKFVRGVEREDKNFDGDTALMLAVLYSDLKMVRLLVEQGKVDLNSKEGEGFTPFMAACANGKIEIVEYFLSDPKCNVAAKNLQGQTAIHRAAFYGEVQVIRLLREHTKLLLNSRDTRGNTCLHFAAMRLNMTCFRYILKKLGDQGESEMKKRNQEGQTPVMLLMKAFNMIKKDDKPISEQEVLNYIQDKNKPPANLYESIKEQKPTIFPKIENPKDMLIRSGNQPMKIATIAEQDDGNISKNNNSNGNNPNSATTNNNNNNNINPVNKQSVELEQITKQPEIDNNLVQVNNNNNNNNSNNNIIDPKSMEAVVPGEQLGATIKELNFSSSEENNLLKRRPNSQKINLKNIASQLRGKLP